MDSYKSVISNKNRYREQKLLVSLKEKTQRYWKSILTKAQKHFTSVPAANAQVVVGSLIYISLPLQMIRF